MFTWIEKSYLEVFPFDGYDPVNNTIFGKAASLADGSENLAVTAHKKSLYAKAATFFNLPTRIRKDGNPGLLSSLKNWFFWPDNADASIFRKTAGILGGVVLTPFKLLSVITSTVLHTLMLVTELLPLALQNLSKEKLGDDSILAKLFGATHFLGRTITSPMTSIRMALKKEGAAGRALAILSAVITMIAYTALAPFVLTALFNTAITLAPQLLTTFFASPLPNALYLLLDFVMSGLMPLTNLLMTLGMSFGSAITTTINIIIGFSVGAFTTLPSMMLHAGYRWIENLFNRNHIPDAGSMEYTSLTGANTKDIYGNLDVTEVTEIRDLAQPLTHSSDIDSSPSINIPNKELANSGLSSSDDEESDSLVAGAQLTF